MSKVAVVLHAGSEGHENLGRAVHSLLYTLELAEEGSESKLILDGAGTQWVGEWEKPDHMLHGLYKQVKDKGLIQGVCGYCVGAFKTDEPVKKSGLKTISEFNGHPSVAKLIREGFQVITL